MTGSADFDLGMGEAFDPQGGAANHLDNDYLTRITSWWHFQWCATCGHTFRRGDRVRVDPVSNQVWHLEPGLGCVGSEDEVGQPDAADLQEFLAGVNTVWPVAGDVPVVLTDDQPYLLAPPIGGLRRMFCLYCAHTFRPHELVVICPCAPRQRECRFAVHRDPGLGLVCWERWRPSGTLSVCPVTQRRLGP